MASQPSFWRKLWLPSWFKSRRPNNGQRKNARNIARRSLKVECLEGRTMLSVTVTATAGNALLANASEVAITGTGFDPIVANNTVSLTDGSDTAAGTVIAATPTSLEVEIAPSFILTGGALTAVVHSDSVSSGAAVTVATVAPVVTAATDNMSASTTSITINGFGFDTTQENDSVTFNASGTPITGTVTGATANTLTVTIPSAPPAGAFTALVDVDSSAGTETQVATITPVVTSTTTNNVNANTTSITINGFGFDSTAANNTIVFNDGAVAGTITAASATALTVSFATAPTTAGALTAVVTTDGVSSGTPEQVATIKPFVTSTTTNSIAANATTVTINGFGFDPTVANDSVVFTDGAGSAVGTVTSATPTTLTVTFSTDPTLAGDLSAVVSVEESGTALTSGATKQVATVDPVVTASTADLGVSTTSITIDGFGFDSTIANDAVVFNASGTPITGTVTGATANTLTVTIPSAPPVGSLTATVTTDTEAGTATQVATVTPVVLANTGNLLSSTATSVTIIGAGFDTTAANNTITFNDGAVAGTITSATATSLTVNLATKPTTAGPLTAVVTTDSVSSGTAVQVATVTPTVTSTTTNSQPANVTTLTINGHGFDPVAGNNVLSFNNHVSGTVTAATPTSLIVALTTTPATTIAGPLTVVVSNTNGATSGTPVQVATLTPVVTASTADLAANTATLTISGYGFYGTTASNNTVTFSGAAVGTVTAASPTSLTVTFSTPPTAGALTATVDANGTSSTSAVQVANVVPVVLSNVSYKPSATATTILINGYGFDTTAANDVVTLSDGTVVSSVTANSANLLTVSLSASPTSAGNLTAEVTTDGASSAAVQVATVTPVVTSNTTSLSSSSSTLTIAGHGFDPTAGSNTVTFIDGTGTATGTVTAATATSLTVTFGTVPTVAGPLTAVVTTDGAISGLPVQVATVAPAVTASTANFCANAATLVISGTDFDATAAKNTVVFDDGAVGYVSSASTTSLTVTLSTMPSAVGSLTAVVTTDNVSSGTAVQVATVVPAVTLSTAALSASASTITINGFDFDLTSANNTVVFNDGAVASSVTANSANSLTVTFSTKPTAGNLTAVVTTDGDSRGTAVQVATVAPVVTSSSASLAANAATLTIAGTGFDPAGVNTVAFNDGAVGTVTAVTATSLTVTFSTEPATAGPLTAVVTTDGASSNSTPVQVATVTPAVTSSTAALPANATTLTIDGFGFDTTASHNTVVFTDGVVGAVTAATANALTVALLTDPTGVANLNATVTTDGVGGTQTQVAAVTPVVLANSGYQLAANASSVVINGVGFDTTLLNNTVVFNDGTVGTVTGATATSLTVSFTTKPVIAGSLTAVVTTDGTSSGMPVTVASVAPVVTSSTASLSAGAATITINGFGFNPTASGNTVTFINGGAVGTVTVATTTSLTVTFSTPPISGNLTALVHTNSISSGAAVQVATVGPSVTLSNAALAANATSVTITGSGFDASGTNTVVLSNGAVVSGVTVNSATSLTVSFSTKPTAGPLTAVVTTDGQSSGAAEQVAAVTPVVTSSSTSLLANAATITINGFGFDPTAAHNAVAFNGGATGIVIAATATSLTVKFTTVPTGGNLTAIVSTNGLSSGNAVQVATVTPVVTSSIANQAINGTTLTINGYGFDPTLANDTITFTDGAVDGITAATATSLTVTLSTKPTAVGSLTAQVHTNGVSSGSFVQVATVTPVVTSTTTNTLANGATQVTINGFGFNTTFASNTVAFNNGAVGTVTAGTANSLTVTFGTKPAAGNLTAVVTNGGISSGTPIQVATLAPVVTSATTSLAANLTTLTISGSNFDPTPANNTVLFSNGAVGTVIGATSTALTVTFTTKPATAGSLTAVVTTNGVSSGAAVQVANVTPVVTSSTASLALNGSSLVITGFGFDPTAAHNTVTFNDGAVGTVSAATPTSLTVSFSTKPTATGSLTAVVTTDSVTSGTAVQVATVVSANGSAPTVTSSTSSLLASATTITIHGTNFNTTPANNTVTFSSGAVGAVTGATATTLTVTFSTLPTAGSLTAVVTTEGVGSGSAVQVASVAPVVTSSTANLAVNATTVIIRGYGFDPTVANNSVTLNGTAAGTVTVATSTSLTVTFTNASKLAAGSLTAAVTTDTVSSGSAVQVATVMPVVTSNTANLTVNAGSVVITGFGFSTTAANNTVTFNNGAVAGTITSASATSLTVTLATKPTKLGSLTATVGVGGVTSAAVQVATVVPVVTTSTASLAPTATQITINGFGFDTTPSMNTVVFNNGAAGIVTGATATSLTVTFSVPPAAGNLTAVVTTDGASSGTAVQVASVTPVVTMSTASLSATATQLTISGYGFSATPANNTVVFSGLVTGTVTAATPTSLTVTIANPAKLTVGSLTAVVTTNSVGSGTAVQVASVIPGVTASTASLAINANTLVITGSGFDPIAANNSITFNDGAVDGITAATATSLTVTFSTKPTATGNLTAIVTTDHVSSGAAVQVATVAPAITASTASALASATTITIAGFGFSTGSANSVVFSNGAVASAVDASTANSITYTFSTKPAAGNLTAIITSGGVSSGTAVQVATIAPVVTLNTASLTISSTTQVVINGFGFSTTAASNTVVFNNGGQGTVTAATPTSLTVTFTSGHKPTAGSLTAVVTTNSVSSGVAVQVATMV